MSGIKALEKLHNMYQLGCGCDYETCGQCSVPRKVEKIADEVEAEITERYMELPVDADGVPIHVGDTLQLGDTGGEVVALTYCPSDGKFPWEWKCDTGGWHKTAFARHAKPQTLEEVLGKALVDASCAGADIGRYINPLEPYMTGLADTVRTMVMREMASFE